MWKMSNYLYYLSVCGRSLSKSKAEAGTQPRNTNDLERPAGVLVCKTELQELVHENAQIRLTGLQGMLHPCLKLRLHSPGF